MVMVAAMFRGGLWRGRMRMGWMMVGRAGRDELAREETEHAEYVIRRVMRDE